MQRASALVAVERGRLGVADRKVAVGAQLRAEEEHVPRAVHRLQRQRLLALVRLDEEHVLAVVVVVAGGDVRLDVVEERRLHLDVPALAVLSAAQVLERVPEHHPLRVPERRAGRVVGEVEEVELDSEPAVVSRPCLLEPLEVRVEVRLGEEGRAVDARELRVALVAAPVRAREARELHGLDRRRVLQVRAAAEICERALRVEGDVTVRVAGELDLVRLLLRLEAGDRVRALDLLARPLATLRDLLADLVLDRPEVGVGDRFRELEVVVEAVARWAGRSRSSRPGAAA